MDLSTQQLLHCVCMILILSWVKSSEVNMDCDFGDKDGEGAFRLFPGVPEGRVEVRCKNNSEWGTISSSGTENIVMVATLVCRKLGYGGGSPIDPPSDDDEHGGFGPVWDVTCDEQDMYIDNCTFTKTTGENYKEPPTLEYWPHEDDLYVTCGASGFFFESQPESIVTFIAVDVATFTVLLCLIILSGFIVYRLIIRNVKSVRSSKSAYRATTSV